MSSTVDATSRILLVEDNETIRNAFTILLEEEGYQVVQARSGSEALSEAETSPPDLVLMDLGLPDMHGLDVTRRLKNNPRTRNVVIVAITGRALETDRAAAVAAGCAGYLAKPVDTRQLIRSIPGYLKSSE